MVIRYILSFIGLIATMGLSICGFLFFIFGIVDLVQHRFYYSKTILKVIGGLLCVLILNFVLYAVVGYFQIA